MNTVVKVDENVIVMQAFIKIVKRYYEGKGVFRDVKALKKIRKALLEPEYYCRLNINPNKVFADYEKLKMSVETKGYDPYQDVDVEQFVSDILSVTNGMIDSPDDFGDMPFVNAGIFLEMINDKIYGYYKTGEFGKGHDDAYYIEVLDKQMEIYEVCKDTNKNNSDSVDVEQIAQKVKDKILGDIMQEIPKAFEKATYTNVK